MTRARMIEKLLNHDAFHKGYRDEQFIDVYNGMTTEEISRELTQLLSDNPDKSTNKEVVR